MRHVSYIGVLLMALCGTPNPVHAEMRYALMVLTYNCDAATLSRVQDAVDLLPDEALLVVANETLCVEESRVMEFGSTALVPSAVEIVKPPASVDMSEAGYLVVIKQVIELDPLATDA